MICPDPKFAQIVALDDAQALIPRDARLSKNEFSSTVLDPHAPDELKCLFKFLMVLGLCPFNVVLIWLIISPISIKIC